MTGWKLIEFLRGNRSLQSKERFPPVPQPQSSQVRFMRTLLVSADLTADEISATGGHRRFVPSEKDDREDL